MGTNIGVYAGKPVAKVELVGLVAAIADAGSVTGILLVGLNSVTATLKPEGLKGAE